MSVSKVIAQYAFFVTIFRSFMQLVDFLFIRISTDKKDNFHRFFYWKMMMKMLCFKLWSFIAQKKHMARIPSLSWTQLCIWFYHHSTLPKWQHLISFIFSFESLIYNFLEKQTLMVFCFLSDIKRKGKPSYHRIELSWKRFLFLIKSWNGEFIQWRTSKWIERSFHEIW